MKKLFYTMTAVIAFSLVFISCDKDPKEENGVKKLPSKILWVLDDEEAQWTFKYDERNLLTEIISTLIIYDDEWGEQQTEIKIEYDANNRPSKITYFGDINGDPFQTNTFQYMSNNQMIMNMDGWTYDITLNNNGQITKLEDLFEDIELIYIDRNLIQAKFMDKHDSENYYQDDYNYSDVLNVFRYAANPDWLLFLIGELPFFSSPSKNMLAKQVQTSSFYDGFREYALSQYQTDSDGYALSCKVVKTDSRNSNIYTEESIMTFEYVSAK